jgi:hypothetical protein
MPCDIRQGVTNIKPKRSEAQENIRRTRNLSKMAHDQTRMEMKRKQAMLKEKETKNEHER